MIYIGLEIVSSAAHFLSGSCASKALCSPPLSLSICYLSVCLPLVVCVWIDL